jgi:1-acyl-sn-glycerol-3-phosphate acyltransferase
MKPPAWPKAIRSISEPGAQVNSQAAESASSVPVLRPEDQVDSGYGKRPGRFYDLLRVMSRGVFAMTMRWRITGMEHVPESGGFLVAACHLNHLDPVVVSTVLPHRISWISRMEFCRHWLMRRFLYHSGAFPVNRQGYARPALRESLERLAAGEVVGIFPEGEIMSGSSTVLRGGSLRHGVCWLAACSGRPVLPVVILGTDRLSQVDPWLPAKRGRLWFTVGPPLAAPPEARSRAGRAAFAARLEDEFRRLAGETLQRNRLPETIIP